jgi:hypothetical protein
MISGAMVGTYANPYTQWNGEGSFDLAASGGLPTPLTVTSMLPSGETAAMTINLSRIDAMPAAGTFDCTSSDNYSVNIAFQVFPQGSSTATTQYVAQSGCGNGCSCSLTLQATSLVSETSDEGSFQVYSAHGSLTAVMPNQPPLGGTPDGTVGMLNLTW